MDLFVTYAYQDADYASGLEDTLAGRGLVVGEPLALWPGQRLLPPIDGRLREARIAVVVVSREFLAFAWPRKELDGLATRRQVVAVLSDVGEADVAGIPPGSRSRRFRGRCPSGWSACSDPRTRGSRALSGRWLTGPVRRPWDDPVAGSAVLRHPECRCRPRRPPQLMDGGEWRRRIGLARRREKNVS